MATNSQRPIIPTPVSATQERMVAIRNGFVTHFKSVLSPELLIAHRKSTYALIINASDDKGNKLETMVGTANAKAITTDVLETLLANVAVVPNITDATIATTYKS